MKFSKLKEKSLCFPLVAAAITIALVACGPQAQNFSILGASQSTFQGSVANNKVDILWVVDNSGSMLLKQQNLRDGFDSFADVFVTKGFDFRMGIVTTDTRTVAAGGQESFFQGSPTVITSSTPSFASTFKTNIVVGAGGFFAAKGLDAIVTSLNSTNLAGNNSSFLRSDAHLAVIVLSDADDNDSTTTTAQVTAFLDTLKPQKYDVLARTYKNNYTISAVVAPSASDANCDTNYGVGTYEKGTKFISLANSTNGSVASICDATFGSGLTTISQRIAEAITEIPLSSVPNLSTLTVAFNTSIVPQNATNGWTYSSTGNKIVFHGTYIPTDNTAISINYIPNDITR